MHTKDYLRANGYVSITYGYVLPEQLDMLEAALAQLRKGNRDFEVHEEDDVAEIYVRMPCPPIPEATKGHE